ncbi:GreA/GreB family elongation factor [Arenibacter algicola]|jgi:regulator of nucleoside diphosphate kinase|uniref:Regulator of nucleoside diphosphate kinase n=1 Tax=Arenibacter algicola TaxID=616991 RepID=A0A221UZ18_9FLAO|nr:GreA/GreB family elongation factor [Arenibacter algicola]ASO06513.1 regulator of nucleoside diphosphate kinase [Arenibacter algicola]MDX1767670.1 GreA/GreB family elongation factor [Arenibacter troitsensis]HCO82729.1 transcription elongation factor GreAB [Arenibacter sp.]|tara:strand:+ start:3857 stop:4276 length:420 start_codon:yes stop_codon:yes gene_type:complete
MKYKNLIIEKKEFVLLKRYMNLMGYYKDETLLKSVKKLQEELGSAQIFDEADMPKDVIRFNTKITIVSQNGWHRTFKLVLPKDSDVKNDKVSILTPMGAAVMGYAESDSISWEFPSGEQILTIEKVEQDNQYININMVL